ncbi:hypothetical protein HGRIS_007171 [Hohenbuehelia grisea]|uniref:Uncharacterized protein n=1 Tax=Hohenbuehelia grisea TaxID=104357 RepID=A0ABR3JCX9_9AGAR
MQRVLPLFDSTAGCRPCLMQIRQKSTSPYGRTHVWKRRAPALPNPLVPKFPQQVIRSDGTSFTHWTTSPRSLTRLTRDTTSNPLWNTGVWTDDQSVEEEGATTGRLGRFNRRFEGIGGAGTDVDWMGGFQELAGSGSTEPPPKQPKFKKPAKK